MRANMISGLVVAAFALAASAVYAADYELKWDNGTVGAYGFYGLGSTGCWFGNDFNVSTLNATCVSRLKIMSSDGLTNDRWDGFRIALFGFSGSPGSIIWPESGIPMFVRGSGNGFVWCEFAVSWALPGGTSAFLAAQEQYYSYPDCDPYCFDNNLVNLGHTWQKSPSTEWTLNTSGMYRNLMLRVFVADSQEVAPTSLGRIKALYF